MGRVGEHEGSGPVRRVGNVLFGADRPVAEWVGARVPGFVVPDDPRALGVVVRRQLVAGVVFERWNGVHIEASIAVDQAATWASKETLRTLFWYPFGFLQCKAISVAVPSSNPASLNLATKLGFEPEALIKYAAHDGSTLVVLKMHRETCKWMIEHGQGKPAETAGSV